MTSSQDVDVLILGGGPAGLSAALCLGRARKRAVVLDAGAPRHSVAAGVHNFLTREGMAPAELRRVAWEQLAAYPSVERAPEQRVTALRQEGALWVAEGEAGGRWRARAALLATGVIDEHPEVPGYAARWGRSIFMCPFCHGWEARDLPLAVMGSGEGLAHMGPLLKGWSADVVALTHGAPLEDAHAAALRAASIPVYTAPVAALEGPGDQLDTIRLADGRALERRGLFVITSQRQVPVVASLGLAVDPMGYVQVDMHQRTSLPMLWAAGDLTSRLQQVVESAAQGLRAGALITATLNMS